MHIDGLSQSCTSNFQLYTRFIRVCVCIHTRGKKKRTTTSTYPRVRKQGGRRLQWRRRMREIEEVPVMCVTRDEFFIVPTYSLSSPFLATHCAQQGKKKKSARPYLKFGKEKRAPVSSFHSICCYLKRKKKKDTPTRAHLSQALVTAPDVHVCTISRLLFLTFYFLIFLSCTSNYIDSRSICVPINQTRKEHSFSFSL